MDFIASAHLIAGISAVFAPLVFAVGIVYPPFLVFVPRRAGRGDRIWFDYTVDLARSQTLDCGFLIGVNH
jgi:hypothetical protein